MKKKMFFLILIFTAAIMYVLPFLYPDMFFLCFVALIPCLYLINKSDRKKSFLYGWLFGNLILWGVGFWLIRPMVNFGGIPLSLAVLALETGFLVLGLYYAIIFFLLRYFKEKGANMFLLGPLIWGGIEYLRSLFTFRFPFGFWGYALAFKSGLIQLASWTGVFGVSALIFLINQGFFEFALEAYQSRKRAEAKKLSPVIKPAIVIFLAFLFLTASSYFTSDKPAGTLDGQTPLSIGIVQPNIPQWMKWNSGYKKFILNKTLDLTAGFDRIPELVIWPESSLPFDPFRDRFLFISFKERWQKIDSHLLAGSLARSKDSSEIQNSIFFFDGQGTILDRYNKNLLVPFGEYNPFPFLEKYLTVDLINQKPGTEKKLFNFKGKKWGNPVCYEILESEFIRKLAWNADFLITPSNEAWYGRSSVPFQMLSASIFRAVENGIPVIRVANTSSSAVIDGDGRIIKLLPQYQEAIGVISFIPQRKQTFFTIYGNVAGKLMLFFTIILLVRALFGKRKCTEV